MVAVAVVRMVGGRRGEEEDEVFFRREKSQEVNVVVG